MIPDNEKEKYFDHWDKVQMTQEEALAWFESELEATGGKRCSSTCPQCQAIEWAIKALSVKFKKGKWIRRGRGIYVCSECSRFFLTKEDLCPNCYAYMKEDEK